MVAFRQIVHRIAKRVRLFFSERSLGTFCLFLLFATILWFGHALNAVRERTIHIPVEYVGVADNITFETPLPEEFLITIRDQGKRLRNYGKGAFSAVQIDLSALTSAEQSSVVLSAEQIRPKLADQLQGTAKLQRIRPEQISVDYHREVSKTIPVYFAGRVLPAQQYQLTERPLLTPNKVTVYGPTELLDTLSAVYTVVAEYRDVKDSLLTDIALITPQGVRSTVSTLKLTAWAEQYTEKKFTLSVTQKDVPQEVRLRTFPSMVEVTVRVGISHFADVTAADVEAYCLFPTEETNRLPIKTTYTTPYITNIRCTPSEVEYIIEQAL